MDYRTSQDLWEAWTPTLLSLPVRLAAGLLAGAYLAWMIAGLCRRRSGPLRVLLGGAAALAALAYAIDPRVLGWFAGVPYLSRLRAAMGLLSFTVLSITLESLRKDKLAEQYALLWLATSLLILVTAFFPHLIELFRLLTGIEYTGAVMAVLIAFLVLVAFHFSLALSRHREHQAAAAQRLAVLEQRVAHLEESLRAVGSGAGLMPPPPKLPEALGK